MFGRLPRVFNNPVTIVGAALAALALGLIGFLILLELFSRQTHPYLGLITYIVLPAFFMFGLFVAFVGIVRAHRRARAGRPEERFPLQYDLTVPQQRRAVILAAALTLLLLVVSAFGSYQAYQYTDSVEFCGKVCHSVMKPEYTAYLASPHARVACVECHIGPGADYFVKSKITGSYQVYSVLFHKYHRPIETPIANLRPARETCEQCHWPKHFFSAKMQNRTYFLSDEKNSRSQMNLLVKIGGGDPRHGASEGIHYHMYVANSISYIARDRQHLDIPYIESREPNGKVTIFRSTEDPLTDAEIKKGEKHIVDCIECHNRPTHIFRHPEQSVNQAMAQGWISPTLPMVKKVAVDTLEMPQTTEAGALASIKTTVESFYQKEYPQVFATRRADIDAAVKQIQRIYSQNYFPEMRVSWKGFPDHIGHMYSPGCFRCHDGKHVSSDGRKLTTECTACHTILSQQFGDKPPTVSLQGVPFQHPGDVGDAWKTMKCSDCHGAQAQK